VRRPLFKTTVEQEPAKSEDKTRNPTEGLKEDRGKIGAVGLIAEPGWRGEEALIADAEGGTETVLNAGTFSGNRLKAYSSIFNLIKTSRNRRGIKQQYNILNQRPGGIQRPYG